MQSIKIKIIQCISFKCIEKKYIYIYITQRILRNKETRNKETRLNHDKLEMSKDIQILCKFFFCEY